MLKLCRPQGRRRRATKLLPPLNQSVRVRRKLGSLRLKPCLSNSKLGPTKMRRRRRGLGPYSPLKMPQHRLRKMPHHGRSKSTDTSGRSTVRGQGYRRRTEKRSCRTRMHGYRSRPYKTPHKTTLRKMPRLPRSCRPSVGATRPDCVFQHGLSHRLPLSLPAEIWNGKVRSFNRGLPLCFGDKDKGELSA